MGPHVRLGYFICFRQRHVRIVFVIEVETSFSSIFVVPVARAVSLSLDLFTGRIHRNYEGVFWGLPASWPRRVPW